MVCLFLPLVVDASNVGTTEMFTRVNKELGSRLREATEVLVKKKQDQ